MDKEGKIQRAATVGETDFLLQWGSRKRLRCLKVKEESNVTEKSNGVIRKKITSRIDRRVIRTVKETPSPLPLNSQHKNSDGLKSPSRNENQKSGSGSPEKEERYYTTRGSLGVEENGKNLMMETRIEDRTGNVWPRLLISLSNKEKEEDFLAMKGCKLPQRPKKRAKLVQRTLLLVSPGAWLSDLCQERYEVREKKTSKKRPRGLKAMGSMVSDSE